MSYETWEHYSSLYTDVSETDFSRYETRAEREIDADTHGRVLTFMTSYNPDTATPFQQRVYNSVRFTMDDLINKLVAYDSDVSKQGISSVSNDGYSESYKVLAQSDKSAELYGIVKDGLSGTGMCGAL